MARDEQALSLIYDASGAQRGAADFASASERVKRAAQATAKAMDAVDAATKSSQDAAARAASAMSRLADAQAKADAASTKSGVSAKALAKAQSDLAAAQKSAETQQARSAAWAEKLAVAQANLARSVERGALIAAQGSQSTETLSGSAGDAARKFEKLKNSLDPAAAAAANFRREQETLNRAFATSNMDVDEYDRILAQLQQRYGQVAAAAEAAARPAAPTPVTATSAAAIDQRLGIGQSSSRSADEVEQTWRELDRLQQKFSPTAAAARRYSDALDEVAQAERAGVLAGEALTRAQTEVEQSLNPVVVAARQAAQAQEQQATRARALVESYDAEARGLRVFNEVQREAAELRAKGLITVDQQETVLRGAREAMERSIGTQERLARGSKLTAHEMQNLTFQMNDVVASLGSGASPMQILLQQGPQVTQVFGGLGNTLARIPKGVIGMGAALTAIGVPAAIVGGRFAEIEAQARRLESTARNLNPQLRGMATAFRNATFEVSAQGTDRGTAEKMLTQLSRVRGLQVSILTDMARLSVDIAAQQGMDPADVAARMADAFLRGSNGIREFARELTGLGEKELDQIEKMDRTGDRAGALRKAIELMARDVGGEAKRMQTDWDAAFASMGQAYDAFVEGISQNSWFGEFMRAQSKEAAQVWFQEMEALKDLANKLFGTSMPTTVAAAGTGPVSVLPTPIGVSPKNQVGTGTNNTPEVQQLGEKIRQMQIELRDAEAALERLGNNLTEEMILNLGKPGDPIVAATEQVHRLKQALEAARTEYDKLATPGTPAPNAATTTPGKPTTLREVPDKPANPSGLSDEAETRVRKATEAYNEETKALQGNARQRAIAMAGLQAYTAAIEANRTPQEASRMADLARAAASRDQAITLRDENEQLDLNARKSLAVARAYQTSTAAGLQAAAARQAATDSLASGVDEAKRTQQILDQGAADQFEQASQGFAAMRQQVDDLKQISEMVQAGMPKAWEETARRSVEVQAAFRASMAAAVASGDDKMISELSDMFLLYSEMAEQRDRYNRVVASGQVRGQLEDEIALLQTEGDMIGRSNLARETELDLLRLRQTLVSQGYQGQELEDEYNKLSQLILLRNTLNDQTRKSTEIFETNRQAIMDSVDIMRDGFEDLVINGEDFNDVLKNLSKAFLQLGMDVMVMAPLKDFMNNAMTSGTATGGDSGNDIWGLLTKIGSAAVSAWSGGGASAMPNAIGDAGAMSAADLLADWKTTVPVAHSGWMVGAPAKETRTVPSHIFLDAKKYHTGGLVAGERAAILQDGEEVLTATNPRHRRNFRGGSAGGPTVIMNITTPDANSFRQSQGQMAASTGRAMTLAARRNS